jgi:hypothetical protein
MITRRDRRSKRQFVAQIDPQIGLLQSLESMRYKGTDSEGKTLWINDTLQWGTVDGNTIPVVSAATWFVEGTPWAVFTVEDIRYNVDAEDYIQAKGP